MRFLSSFSMLWLVQKWFEDPDDLADMSIVVCHVSNMLHSAGQPRNRSPKLPWCTAVGDCLFLWIVFMPP